MSTTITIRASEPLREALLRRAEARGTSLSETVREILEEAVAERPLESRVGHLKARLRLASDDGDGWRAKLRERNWRS